MVNITTSNFDDAGNIAINNGDNITIKLDAVLKVNGINLTKTLNYTARNLTGVSYS